MESAELLRQSIRRAQFARSTPSARPMYTAPDKPVEVDAPPETPITVPCDDPLARIEGKLDELIHILKWRDQPMPGRVHRDKEGLAYLSMGDIRKVVSSHFGISVQEIDRQSRDVRTVYARHVAFYLCKTHTLRSLPAIGRMFGHRDHTTILHGVRKVTDQRLTNSALDQDLIELEAALEAELQRQNAA